MYSLFLISSLLIPKIININKLIAISCPISTPRLKPKSVLRILSSEKPTSKRKPPKPNPWIKPKIEAMNKEKKLERFLETNVK